MSTRRDFLRTTAGAGVGLGVSVATPLAAAPGIFAPTVLRSRITPVCVASGNGLAAAARAMEELAGGATTVEAVVRGVNLVEEDPDDSSVGYGGLPNAEGVVQLDASVMHGPTRGAGAVAALEGIMRPSLVALDVMRYTGHVLLVGDGAQRFARSMGHRVEDLLTDEARRRWVEWRARLSEGDDYLTPEESIERFEGRPFRPAGGYGDGLLDSHDGVRPQGTINCNLVSRDGDLSGVTTTSGLAFKIPGRVGDSPLIGAGLYVDNDVGAAGSTGLGEAVIKVCGSHAVVELMRAGMHPTDACLEALRRIVRFTVEPRRLDERGHPTFNVNFYAVNREGAWGGAAIWSGARFAVNVDGEARTEDSAYLLERRG
jgi:N4-(beta-N-acetylglucosaminyl)-L-asparaginase